MKKFIICFFVFVLIMIPMISKDIIQDLNNKICPVMGGKAIPGIFVVHEGVKINFCCPGCDKKFKVDPKKYLKKMVWNHDGVKYITKEKLKSLMKDEKKLVIIDVLSAESFKKQHVKGAINIPFGTLKDKIDSIVPDKKTPIVTYCANYHCKASTKAAKVLLNKGYKKVYDYKGGIAEWSKYLPKCTGKKCKIGCTKPCCKKAKKCKIGCTKPCCAVKNKCKPGDSGSSCSLKKKTGCDKSSGCGKKIGEAKKSKGCLLNKIVGEKKEKSCYGK